MKVGSEEESVLRSVRSRLAVRPDMRRLQHRQRSLVGDHASPLVCVQDARSECSLAEAQTDEHWVAVALLRPEGLPRGRLSRTCGCQGDLDSIPQDRSVALRRVVSSTDLRGRLPARRRRDPQLAWKEERLDERDTADLVAMDVEPCPIARDPGDHLTEAGGS